MKPHEFLPGVWPGLMADLRRRGNGRRESGAFLLGRCLESRKIVEQWVPYEELDPAALNFEYVRLGMSAFSKLWDECASRGLEVVADVHTHPKLPGQSPSDRANPMISVAGHIALIVPWFASGQVRPSDVSVNVYLGAGAWKNHLRQDAAALINLPQEESNGR